jgi:hypothetical protein
MRWWVGRTTHRLRRVGGELKMCRKKVVLVNAAEPLPNLSFLISMSMRIEGGSDL